MSQRVPSGLGIYTKTMRTFANANAGVEMAVACVDGVNLLAVAAGEPEHLAVGGDASHIRGAVGDFPPAHDFAGGEVDHGDAAFFAIGNVQHPGVAAGVEAVRALACRQKSEYTQTFAVDEMDAIGLHI